MAPVILRINQHSSVMRWRHYHRQCAREKAPKEKEVKKDSDQNTNNQNAHR